MEWLVVAKDCGVGGWSASYCQVGVSFGCRWVIGESGCPTPHVVTMLCSAPEHL